MDHKLGRFVRLAGVLAWLLSPITAFAEVAPQYDVTGIWKAGSYSYTFFQNGVEVKSIMIVNDFGHYYSGKFISPTKFKGIMTRRQQSNGCVTKIEITYSMTSNNTLTEDKLCLDSNCDLPQGKRVTDSLSRAK